MKKKKIIIFTLIATILVRLIFFIRNTFVREGQVLEDVVYQSENLIIHVAKEGTSQRLVILGSGYSLSIDEKNKIVNHDPLMILPSMKEYSNTTTVMSIFYPFECKGLEEASKELAYFVNKKVKEYDEIVLIGHSKCGVCFANAAKWIEPEVTIVTVSAPFTGTPIADRKTILEKLSFTEKMVYSLIFSDHNVDKDIVPDSEFMKKADYLGLKKHYYINIISTCPSKSLNPIDLILMYMDRKYVNGDGIVPEISQNLTFNQTNSKTKRIEATHATSLEKSISYIKEYIPNL